MKHLIALICLLLASCGKEESKPQPKPVVTKKPVAAPKQELPPVPQGKLPKMDPAKAKFIAVPNTPKEPEVKKAEKPVSEDKK